MDAVPRVVYSIGAKFAGGGIGTIAYYGARGLHRHHMLQRVLCGSFVPSDIPREKIRTVGLASRILRKLAVYDKSHRLPYLHNVLYDVWASYFIEPAHLFHAWSNQGRRSLERAKALGMITIVQRASSHPLWRLHLLQEEYARWGMKFHLPYARVQRSLDEFDLADYVLIPSLYVRDTFLANGFPEHKLILLPFGVDTERFRPSHHAITSPFRVLFVGTVTLGKGVIYLLEAWRRLHWQDAELWVVGRIAADIRPLLASYTQVPGIHFKGHQRDIAQMFQQAHVFAFPSLDEGSALVTYEALACGIPVVTTPNAGSLVRDGKEGFIVPPRDVEALAERLVQLRENHEMREAMGQSARARVADYTWQKHGDAYACHLQRVYEERVA